MTVFPNVLAVSQKMYRRLVQAADQEKAEALAAERLRSKERKAAWIRYLRTRDRGSKCEPGTGH